MSERIPMPAANGLSSRSAPPPPPRRRDTETTSDPAAGTAEASASLDLVATPKTRRRRPRDRQHDITHMTATSFTIPFPLIEKVKDEARELGCPQYQVLFMAFESERDRLKELVQRDITAIQAAEKAALAPKPVDSNGMFNNARTSRYHPEPSGSLTLRLREENLLVLDNLVLTTQAANRSQLCRVVLRAYFDRRRRA